MYRIHQISEDDRNTVYQILHINRGKRNKNNLKFHTYAYEIQDVLESVDRILKEMNKVYNMEFIEGLGMSVRLTSYFECALHNQKITDEEFGYLLKMHNISKTPSKNTTNTLKRQSASTWDSCQQQRFRSTYNRC